MVPADPPSLPLRLSPRPTGSQSSPEDLGAFQVVQAELARLRADAQQFGMPVIAEWLRRTEFHLTSTPHLLLVSDAPSGGASIQACPARTLRKHSERLALAGD